MSTGSLPLSHSSAPSLLKRSLLVDTVAWTVIGAALFIAASSLASLFEVAPNIIQIVGGLLGLLSGGAALWINRISVQPSLVRIFALFNVIGAVVLVVALLAGLIAVSTNLFWGLMVAADITLALGLYQFYALRRNRE